MHAGRQLFVSVGKHVSDAHHILYGVPQGSILGPLFSLHMLLLGQSYKKMV